MSTAKATLLESVTNAQLRGLPSRQSKAAERLNRIRDLASSLLDEAESLDHENSLAETTSRVDSLNLNSGVDFFEEVRRFEMKLIARALELTGGNQARAARLLGLGTTTLNYKIKSYGLT